MILIIGGIHDKNKIGLINILEYLKIAYTFGHISAINQFNIIYSPSHPINTTLYPNKKFIFGPHFSVFPDNKLLQINNIHNNCIYIQPSEWASNVWKNMRAEKYISIKTLPFPVDTTKFSPKLPEISNTEKKEVFLYYKRRKPEELKIIQLFLQEKNIKYKIFDYVKKYNEEEYLHYLQQSKYGIILDAHESQGFAIEEALSCNVPLLVWSAQTMNQEYQSNYNVIPCTTIPYWDERCGEYFHKVADLVDAFQLFQVKLENNQYNPRQYILDNLSTSKCAERFMELIKF